MFDYAEPDDDGGIIGKIFDFSLMGMLGVFVTAVGGMMYCDHQSNLLLQRTSRLADANRDGIITTNEWRGIYQTLDIPYNEVYPPVGRLSNSQLEKYISIADKQSPPQR